ncbi:MAG: hypothetical protein ABIQ32_08195 [Sphingomicrobium sp.]
MQELRKYVDETGAACAGTSVALSLLRSALALLDEANADLAIRARLQELIEMFDSPAPLEETGWDMF